MEGQVHENLAEALALAVLGVRLALRVVQRKHRHGRRDRSILAKAYGVFGSALRASGHLHRAWRILDKAWKLARPCLDHDIRSDIHRRRALLQLQLYLAQKPDGTFAAAQLTSVYQLAEQSVQDARSKVARARSAIARGVVLVYSGDGEGAARDARAALELLDPRARPYDHASALSLLVYALTLGEHQDRDEAARYLEKLRAQLPVRSPAIRARLLWAEALLLLPNRRRKARARKLLDRARRTFVRLKMQAESLAITAELARLDPEGAVPQHCAEVLPLLAPGPIQHQLEQLKRARLTDRIDTAGDLLRTVGGPGVVKSGRRGSSGQARWD